MKDEQQSLIQLNKHETNAMEYLFDDLIELRKLDECLKYILKSKSYAIGDDSNWDKTFDFFFG